MKHLTYKESFIGVPPVSLPIFYTYCGEERNIKTKETLNTYESIYGLLDFQPWRRFLGREKGEIL